VKRIAQESPVVHVDDAAERSQRQIGRPSTVANFRKQVVGILQETPDLASLEILQRVREAGYQGGKTALYALAASLRPKPAKPLVRFEGLPGEFSQHDFGEVEVEFLNGARRMGEGVARRGPRRRYPGSCPGAWTVHSPRWTLRANTSFELGRSLAGKVGTGQNFRKQRLRISGTHNSESVSFKP